MGGLLPCPFCGGEAERKIAHDILTIKCPSCVSVGFHNHVGYGTYSETEWNTRTADPIKAELMEALDKLARLGNGDHYGNSEGNRVAIAALAKAKGE